jgi:hypothetical protein
MYGDEFDDETHIVMAIYAGQIIVIALGALSAFGP